MDYERVTEDLLRLDAPSTTFRIGEGTAAGANQVMTVDRVLTRAGELAKTDLCTLVLTAANSYTGGTSVAAGTMRGTAVSLVGAIEIGAAGIVQFDQAGDDSFAGTLADTGEGARGYVDLTARFVTGERNDADVDLEMTGTSQSFNVRTPVGARSRRRCARAGGMIWVGSWSLAGQAGAIGGGGERLRPAVVPLLSGRGAGSVVCRAASWRPFSTVFDVVRLAWDQS